jgi:rhomboid protease GluP
MEDQSDRPGVPGPESPTESTFILYNQQTKENEVWTTSEIEEERKFQEALAATPRALVTPALIGINTAVFVAMVLSGLSPTDPPAESLLRWGADFGPLTTHGQWWRLLTAGFVHIGILHLLMNMYILWGIGTFTERLFGKAAFAAMYLFAGIGGNLVSLAWQPSVVAAGASGAVFGLYGGLLGYLLMQRHTVPPRRLKTLYKGAGVFLAFNIVYGLMKANVDVAAHIGGFFSGLLLGCGLALPLAAAPASRLWRSLAVALAGSAIVAGAVLRIPVVDDLKPEMDRFSTVETTTVKLYSDALKKVATHQESPQEFAQVVNQQILPPWNAERERILKLRLSPRQRTLADQVAAYMELRADTWSQMAQGVATNDITLVRKASQTQAAADAIVRRMSAANQKR